ncbi:tyrosyl-tRNA synthetase [Suhomyces tanzawaensis NRRL Y-17324]|uniref:Tyrosine--tRNA ligase n=1 Tax=Suhomyces tanzawaensis NRRL Y-17324 TaxID=984487 RepID=A0A1E4SQK9_9ASCO|nr:tyrosyl-tRNA synthetase [Suhomyces tanzawaensis NRRL Y-17324]ODV81789.1 tyrosyl-tRNA synthetase [Suhomyces tanzawaensis NRRL Y-17324]
MRTSWRCVRFTSTSTVTIIPPVHAITNPDHHAADIEAPLVGYLQSRYLVESITNDELFELSLNTSGKKFKLYCGADPTATSLHLGNLLPLMVLLHFHLRGHDVVGLVGGATGAVGDPSGRTTERSQLEDKQRLDNVQKIQNQMVAFLNGGVEYAKSRNYPVNPDGHISTANNASWWESIKMLDFLANYGRFIRVSSMLGRDSIQSRLKSQHGLGFNEFTYQILQAYDFWHLYKHHGVNMQIGGNDQWGNITAGTDLISRLQKHFKVKEESTYGMTVPLLTTPTGEKFGKSAGNAVFIDTQLTSPYQMYQYFINTPDEMVARLLKVFTLLPLSEIEGVVSKHESDPGLRLAQRILAREVVDLIHGNGVGEEMAYITGFLFPTPDQPFNDELSADRLLQNFKRSGILVNLKFEDFNTDDLKMSTLLSQIIGKSKRETKNLIKSGGIYLGLERDQFEDPEDVVLFDKDNHLLDGKLMLVRVGKQVYHVVHFT